MARTFDQISREDGRLWPATDFVRWLADEAAASRFELISPGPRSERDPARARELNRDAQRRYRARKREAA